MSHLRYSTSAVVQVQKGVPTKLLLGTDLLFKLGYFFIQTSEDGDDCDMLTTKSDNDDCAMLATKSDINDNLTKSTAIQKDEGDLINGVLELYALFKQQEYLLDTIGGKS